MIFASCAVSAAEHEKPVTHLAKQTYTMHTALGDASVPVEISVDLNAIHPEITRAAIVFHGKGRNVEGYFSALERAAHEAGQGLEKAGKVTVYYTEDAGKKIVHYFKTN